MKIKREKQLAIPTNQLINDYLDKFNSDPRYAPADKAIVKLFKAFPNNIELEDIILKISVINDLYSTNIFGTFKMATHIKSLNIDERLGKGDPELVRLISTGHGIIKEKTNKEICFYSFASKYCNWHNRDAYAIYDQFVRKVLVQYRKQNNFYFFQDTDLENYSEFMTIMKGFKNYYGLDMHNLKNIDKFLWIYGKEEFPGYYWKKNKKAVNVQETLTL